MLTILLLEVVDMNMPAEGVFHNVVIVSIKQRYPGQARKVMYALWGLGLMMLAKNILSVVNMNALRALAPPRLRPRPQAVSPQPRTPSPRGAAGTAPGKWRALSNIAFNDPRIRCATRSLKLS